jgi:hypothetical protein
MKKETMAASESTKKKNLFLGILFDAVECCLYGAFVWRVFRCFAPMAAAYLMTRMYKGTEKWRSGNFIEEIVLY